MRTPFPAAMLWIAAAVVPAAAQVVEGRILEDHSGEALASAELRFHKAGMRELAADLETDRDGRFRAAGLPAGEYTVDVSKSNHITTTLAMRVPAANVLVRLVRYAIIAGTVRDTEGRPVPGRISIPSGRTSGSARIAVLVRQPGSDQLKIVRQQPLDENGKYRIYDMPPGQYAVGLWWAGLSVGSGAQMYPENAHPRFFDVAGGEDYRNIDFLVTSGPSYSVSGRIEAPRKDMHFSITLGLPELPALPVAQMWTETDGAFRLEKIPPGTYDIFVAGPTGGYGAFDALLAKEPVYGRSRIQVLGQNLTDVNVPVSPGRTVDVVLRGPAQGCPKSTPVYLTLLEPWGLLGGDAVQAASEKPQTARDLAPAQYGLAATRLGAGCYQLNQPVVDLSREAPGPVEIRLGQAGSIRGTLRAGSVSPKGFAVTLLEVEAPAGAASGAQVAFSDEQGRFEFGGLRPGRYRIAAQPAGGGAKARWVDDVAHMIEIDIPAGSTTEVELPVGKGAAR